MHYHSFDKAWCVKLLLFSRTLHIIDRGIEDEVDIIGMIILVKKSKDIKSNFPFNAITRTARVTEKNLTLIQKTTATTATENNNNNEW